MTRLTERDVRDLTARLAAFERDLAAATGLTLRDLAQRTIDIDRALAKEAASAGPGSRCGGPCVPPCAGVDLPHLTATSPVPFAGARVAAVPVSSGEGFIPGFSQCVVAILRHVGCEAHVTAQPDVRGWQEAAAADAELVFVADDHRFIALNIRSGACADDDPATADGYATALASAAGGLCGTPVLLLGLGPVGLAAARRLTALGADLYVCDPDPAALARAGDEGLAFTPVALAEGLARCDVLFDATPAAGIIGAADLRDDAVAAAPGVPSAFEAAARALLGVRHIHEPLAVGVVVMAARALTQG